MEDSRVIFVTGSSGVGKSTLAASLAREIRYQQLSLDKVRKSCGGDTRKAWLEIWRSIRRGKRLVVDATGASRIFRLVYRAAVFEHADPLIVRLQVTGKHSCLPKKQNSEVVLLSNGKQITERYLVEGSTSIAADLDIDATELTRREILQEVLGYLRKRR